MATIVLQVVGAAIGGAIGGPVGATIGRAVGAAAGYAIDQKIFTKDQVITGQRLDGSRFLSSNDGAPIPRVYGRTQIGGQIIWATRFEEVRSQSKQGGKGGPKTKVTQFSYFGNFAVGICAGPVSHISRIWADGSELDLEDVNYRIHIGADDQLPDPLIEALQSTGNTPAYRGLAYVVFEDFPLEKFGNRIPQLTFEVIRTIGKLESAIKSVCLIPGATAFGYSPTKLTTNDGDGRTKTRNRHVLVAASDWEASIDELKALCPNLQNVSLVVSWFGTDLRAGHCQLMPGVEQPDVAADGHPWIVSGEIPTNAHQISQVNASPAFGSTPSDKSVVEAISDLHARGLKVTFYPFIMMDIENDNGLPDPHGGASQPVYPWRGQITCDPAIAQPSSADQSPLANAQINSFSGDALKTDFTPNVDSINFTGTNQWSYRRMILHYAHLCALAGGVDSFIIGSELKGLTSVRDDTNAFPFVGELQLLAGDVSAILGPDCKITYAADWSEYFGYHPSDGSNDLFYNLDALWAAPDIDAIGIDNYMPLADWRSSGDPQELAAGEYDLEYFQQNIAEGEGFDWYYASHQDRQNATRSPITDGNGEPWVWRYKDLKSWWSNLHYERINGVVSSAPTPWQPKSKPFWFTELGCPAINKGANQPNVFRDEKSSQSAIPHFSNGQRDDLIQRNYLQAHLDHWSVGDGLDQNNPLSDLYAGRMVESDLISLWAWDTRPFPAFPMHIDIGSDRSNWTTGHWLNGRLGACRLDEVVAAILLDYGFDRFDIKALPGWVDGFIIPAQAPARQVLEPLLSLFGVSAIADNGRIRFTPSSSAETTLLDMQSLVENNEQPTVTSNKAQVTDLPAEAIIYHDELAVNIQSVASQSTRIEGQSARQIQIQLPAVLPATFGGHLADMHIRDAWIGRDTLQLSVPPQALVHSPGDIIRIEDQLHSGLWQIQAIEDGFERQLSLIRKELPTSLSFPASLPAGAFPFATAFGQPLALLLDIPYVVSTAAHSPKLLFAKAAEPWAGSYISASSPAEDGFDIRNSSGNRATIAKLNTALEPGPTSRWDNANKINLSIIYGQFNSKSQLHVLNGANAVAVQTSDDNWELIQYQQAILESDGTWTLSGLLRAQLGTEITMNSGSSIGSYAVLIDEQVDQIELNNLEKNIPLNWRTGPAQNDIASDSYREQPFVFTDKAARPFSPVHVSAIRHTNDDVSINWIRRSRVYGDDWEVSEIPLGENSEDYSLKIYDGEDVVREIVTSTSNTNYQLADQLSDFGTLPENLSVSVAQMDAFANPGSARWANLNLN